MKPTPIRLTRNGTYDTFDRRYNPLPSGADEDGTVMWDDFRRIPADHLAAVDENRFWTVLDVDGKLLVAPGKWFVDRFGYIITERPYDEQEQRNTAYVY